MRKLLLFSLLAFVTNTYAQTVTFSVTTAPCNHDGVLASTFTGLTPPLTVTYTTQGAAGATIIHTGVSGLTDDLTSYSGGPVSVIATDGTNTARNFYNGMPPFTYSTSGGAAVCPALGGDTAYVSGGTAPYTYQWVNEITSTIAGTTNPINLPAGSYGLEITDAGGCVYGYLDHLDSSTIYEVPTYSVAIITTTASCTNGTATAGTPSGGTAPYSYLWSNSATSPAITGLVTGYYTLTTTDALGCTATSYGYVPQSITISTPITPTPSTCTAHDGAVIAFGAGGLPPYTYLWSNGATTQSQTGLAGGYYNVTTTDANGCIGSSGTYISISTPITVTYATTPTLCTSPTGTATLTISGGTTPYTTSWVTTPVQTSTTATALAQGNYVFNITDAVGCLQSGTVTVPPIDVIGASFASVAPICTLSNGSMTVYASGGVAPYTYAWSTGSTTSGITSVPAGLYHVTITDASGCTNRLSEWLDMSSTLTSGIVSTPASCLFVNDGAAHDIASGGTPPYSYSWTSGGSAAIVTGLHYGDYWGTVTDALGCYSTQHTYVGYDTASDCYCTIEGTVYNDANGNCVQDAGEAGIADIQIFVSGMGYTYTDATGHYYMKVPSGSYTVSETVLSYYPLSSCQTNHIPVSVVAASGCTHTVDFANSVATIHDMHICTFDYNFAVPGNTYTQQVIIKNNGTVAEPAVLAGYKPDGQLLAPSFISAGIFSGTAYYYNTATPAYVLNPGESQAFLVNYSVPTNVPLGTNVVFKDSVAYAAPMSNWLLDYSPWDNVNYWNTTVISSFDPNFKEVYPKGTGATGIIQSSDSILQYTVHFQNTGTAPAEKVVVIDTLDNNLNWTSLSPVYTSAKCHLTLAQSGSYKIATFTFDEINLPPASQQPVTSNGSLTYSIHTTAGLAIGTQFKNMASIYFDYNAPVVTNQTLNTLGHASSQVGTLTAAENSSFTIFPNPANGNFNAYVNADIAGAANLRVSDISGKTLISKAVTLQQGKQMISVDINQLSSGVYLVNLEQNGKLQTQKLVVIKQ